MQVVTTLPQKVLVNNKRFNRIVPLATKETKRTSRTLPFQQEGAQADLEEPLESIFKQKGSEELITQIKRESLEHQFRKEKTNLFSAKSKDELAQEGAVVKGSRKRRSRATKPKSMKSISMKKEGLSPEEATLVELEQVVETEAEGPDNRLWDGFFQNLPVLNKQQEFALGTLIQRAKPILLLQKRMKCAPDSEELATACNLTSDQVAKIIRDGTRAKDLMIKFNIKLVYFCAKQDTFLTRIEAFTDRISRDQFGDLILEGSGPRGLERAVLGYDPTLGHRFSTYALLWIRQVLQRCVFTETNVIHIPEGAALKIFKIAKAKRKLQTWDGLTDRDLEIISKEVDIPVSKIRDYLRVSTRHQSLDAPVMGKNGEPMEPLSERIGDLDDSMAEPLRHLRIRQTLDAALSILEPKERNILKLRYGLNTEDGQPMTLSAIAEIYDVSAERIRQIEEKAKRQVRKAWKKTLIDSDLTSSIAP